MVILFSIIVLIYTILILCFVIGFSLVKNETSSFVSPASRFSIIVPFRNEEELLPDLIYSLEALEYPKNLFEVILVNDDSNDNSVELSSRLLTTTQIDYKIIDNIRTSSSPKKDAITSAILKAKYPYIITTDADCIVPKMWLQCYNTLIVSSGAKMIVAPVTYTVKSSVLEQFQLLDILSLQGATIGGFGLKLPFLCNGANFMYEKEFFSALNGFEGNTTIASGDDIFLLEKALKQSSSSVTYLKNKDAIVTTKPQESFSKLIQQRVRWAAKSANYKNGFGKLTGFIILLMNAAIIALFFLSFIGVFSLWYSLLFLVVKLWVDYLLLYRSAKFFNQNSVLRFYLFSAIFYPLFSTYVAIYAMFNGYKWKGRQFKK